MLFWTTSFLVIGGCLLVPFMCVYRQDSVKHSPLFAFSSFKAMFAISVLEKKGTKVQCVNDLDSNPIVDCRCWPYRQVNCINNVYTIQPCEFRSAFDMFYDIQTSQLISKFCILVPWENNGKLLLIITMVSEISMTFSSSFSYNSLTTKLCNQFN